MTLLRFATLLSVCGLLAAPVLAAEFNDKQKEEIGAIVRQYLLDNPSIIYEAAQKHQENQEKAAAEAAEKVLKEKSDELFGKNAPARPFLGRKDADVAFIEFFDYNCGYCKMAFTNLVKLTEEDKKIKIILIDTPILGDNSHVAAKWAIAAGNQGKYADFHKALMEHNGPKDAGALADIAKKLGLDADKMKKDAESKETEATLTANMDLFRALGLSGTPAFVAKDKVIRGFAGPDVLKQMAAEERAGKGADAKADKK